MAFKSIRNILNNPKALDIFREHGVDVDHPELCALQAKSTEKSLIKRFK